MAKSCYKIRVAIKSKGKGKRSGARVVAHLQIVNNTVYLLTIYDKSEQKDVSDKEIEYLLSFVQE
jgi:mRNA-degrading endonuclease RelE of RelBE toxin-antitoxin system